MFWPARGQTAAFPCYHGHSHYVVHLLCTFDIEEDGVFMEREYTSSPNKKDDTGNQHCSFNDVGEDMLRHFV